MESLCTGLSGRPPCTSYFQGPQSRGAKEPGVLRTASNPTPIIFWMSFSIQDDLLHPSSQVHSFSLLYLLKHQLFPLPFCVSPSPATQGSHSPPSASCALPPTLTPALEFLVSTTFMFPPQPSASASAQC